MEDFKKKYEEIEKRFKKLNPNNAIELGYDQNGNLIYKMHIAGEKIVESQNVKAMEVVINNLEEKKRLKSRGH